MNEEIQKKIEANIKKFDLCALLRLLKLHGYSDNTIYFLGNSSPISHASLCQDIHFSDTSPKVIVTINMGLLGSNSSIPGFIQKLIDTEEINSEQFHRFINFFNHQLMQSFVQLSIPELNINFFLDWKYTQLQYLKLLGLESISTLWLLIKICFPDLVVEVKKNPQIMKLHTSSLVLGRDALGPASYLGNRFNQTLSSYKITLTTESEMSELGTPWPIEIKARLMDLIFPILKSTDLHLSIVLNIKNKYGYLTLGSKSFLGFDRIWKSKHPFQLLIFYGTVKDIPLQQNSSSINSSSSSIS